MANTGDEADKHRKDRLPRRTEAPVPQRREAMPDPSRVAEPVRPKRREKVGV